MEALYDRVLDLLRRLRAAGRPGDAEALLAALTQACNPREILSELRYAVADLPEAELGAELAQARRDLLAELERQWAELG